MPAQAATERTTRLEVLGGGGAGSRPSRPTEATWGLFRRIEELTIVSHYPSLSLLSFRSSVRRPMPLAFSA